ncbi:MAG: hypothetical protein QM529_01755 [Hydrotalea sp.]|nr:hypothetical protein [Hydrotalea sp.]
MSPINPIALFLSLIGAITGSIAMVGSFAKPYETKISFTIFEHAITQNYIIWVIYFIVMLFVASICICWYKKINQKYFIKTSLDERGLSFDKLQNLQNVIDWYKSPYETYGQENSEHMPKYGATLLRRDYTNQQDAALNVYKNIVNFTTDRNNKKNYNKNIYKYISAIQDIFCTRPIEVGDPDSKRQIDANTTSQDTVRRAFIALKNEEHLQEADKKFKDCINEIKIIIS